MTLSNERSYYSEQDIALQAPGFLRIAKVMSYDSGTDTGKCIIDYIEYPFINPSQPNPSIDDSIVVGQVENSDTKIMIVSWEGIE